MRQRILQSSQGDKSVQFVGSTDKLDNNGNLIISSVVSKSWVKGKKLETSHNTVNVFTVENYGKLLRNDEGLVKIFISREVDKFNNIPNYKSSVERIRASIETRNAIRNSKVSQIKIEVSNALNVAERFGKALYNIQETSNTVIETKELVNE